MEVLANVSRSGSVRALQNLIKRGVILTQRSELYVPVGELRNAKRAPRTNSASNFHDAERRAIIDALRAASDKVPARAARQTAWSEALHAPE